MEGMEFYEKLQKARQGYVYPDPTTHQRNESAASEDLMAATYVLIWAKGHVRPLDQPYKGPYKVVSRGSELFVLEVGCKQDKFPIHRLKPHICQEDPQPSPQSSQTPDSSASRTTPTETRPPAFNLEADFPVVGSLPKRTARTLLQTEERTLVKTILKIYNQLASKATISFFCISLLLHSFVLQL